jgi:AAA ATPase-like protein
VTVGAGAARPWPMVGRHDELETFSAVLGDRRCHGFLIHGAAGVGKTRLAEECLAVAASAGHPYARATATAAASIVRVNDDDLVVTVTDDGRGLDQERQDGIGLSSMRPAQYWPRTGVERQQRGHFRITCHLVSALFNLADVRVGISMHRVGDGFRIDRTDEDPSWSNRTGHRGRNDVTLDCSNATGLSVSNRTDDDPRRGRPRGS